MVKGRITYMPKHVIIELDFVKRDFNLQNQSDAMKKMAEMSMIGRDLMKEFIRSKKR